jgi:isopenicillin N synthase-like dioxygenase
MVATTLELPVIDLLPFLNDPESQEAQNECIKAAQAIQQFSAFAVKDHRVTELQNSTFLDLMEDYFARDDELKLKDAHPEWHYQVGSTPENTELPRCARDDACLEYVSELSHNDRPLDFDHPDPKWRFFWRIGQQPPATAYPQLNEPPVVPEGMPGWETQMNSWGNSMHNAVQTVSEMIAVGFGMPVDTFTKLAQYGPHLLAPTGSNLEKYGKVGTVLAGFHTYLHLI